MRQKLSSRRGASLLIALLYFLVCGLVAAVIIGAAMTNVQQRKMRPLFAYAARCELDGQGRILLPQHLQPVVAGRGHVDGLQKQGVGKRVAHQQHALLAHGLQQLLGSGGCYEEHHARVGLFHRRGAQVVAKLIGQGRVDADQLKV